MRTANLMQTVGKHRSTRRAPEAESVLVAMNTALADAEEKLVNRFNGPRLPVIFVVGAPRSGTTLLEQTIIASFRCGYVPNLVSRFWMAPYVGAVLSLKGMDFEAGPKVGTESHLGYTNGFEGPHEFGFFWRRWFRYGDTHKVDQQALKQVDRVRLRKEIGALECAFGAPMIFKNVPAFAFQIEFLARVFPTALFIHSVRDPIFTVQSVYASRQKYSKVSKSWFSVKPPEYRQLLALPVLEQVAGQVYYTRKHICRALEGLEPSRWLKVEYERFCRNPAAVMGEIDRFVKKAGRKMRRRKYRAVPFRNSNRVKVRTALFMLMQKAWKSVVSRDREQIR